MPKINIDEICEPIEVIVGGKTYTIIDIPREMAKKMETIGKKVGDSGDTEPLANLMADILGDEEGDIAKLGLRKLLSLVRNIMNTINEEVEAKNVPKAGAIPSPK